MYSVHVRMINADHRRLSMCLVSALDSHGGLTEHCEGHVLVHEWTQEVEWGSIGNAEPGRVGVGFCMMGYCEAGPDPSVLKGLGLIQVLGVCAPLFTHISKAVFQS